MRKKSILITYSLLLVTSFAHDIETSSWGVCWKRQESMPEAIGPTNTPGADAFCKYRLSDPADLAFLDGFDTRIHAASCTNIDYSNNYEMRSDGFPKVTNTTHRLAFFDSICRRKQNVRNLCPWYDPVEYYGHNLYSGRWGSTFMDSLQFVYPKRHDFGWTTDPYSEFYTQYGRTGWFSVFYGLKKTSVFSPHEEISQDGYPENLFKYAGIAYQILFDVSFYEPDWHVFNNQELDATPFTFEVVLSNAFENVYCTNMLSSSRRLFPQQLAGCNQALSLMDKTVRIDAYAYAITNRSDKYFHLRMSADGTYGGSVTITESAGGGYTASPLNLSFSPGSVTVTNELTVTNTAVALQSPAMCVSVPSCAFGASLMITNVSASLNVDSSGWYYYSGTLSELIDDILEKSGVSETIVHVGTYVDEGIVITIGEEGMFYVDIPKISSGTYLPKGKASFSSQYASMEAYQWQGGGHHENWPANRTYLKYNGINTTFVSSYAATRAYGYGGADEWATIQFTHSDYNPTTTDQWDERVGYGYRAKTHKMNFPSQYLGRIAQEIGTISSKMFDLAPDYDNPSQYVGVDAGDFRNMCERADEWALSIEETWFGQEEWDSPSDVDMFVSRSGSTYTFWIVGSDVEYIDEFPVLTVSASLSLVDDEVLDVYDFPDKPFIFNSNIRSVSEAEWEFPQVRLKD